MGGWTDEDGLENFPDSLWRSFVADRGPNWKSAPSWYRRACLKCLTHITQNGNLSTGALMENQNTPTQDDHYFELVGEAYVHGMMDGEGLRLGLEEQNFEIR